MADETEKQTRMEASRQKKGIGRGKKKNTLDVPHFLKRMVLISYGLVFITKEIRTICLHTHQKRRRREKGKAGVEMTGKEIWKDRSQTFPETEDENWASEP